MRSDPGTSIAVAMRCAAVGVLMTLVLAVSACRPEQPQRSGEFKLNPGDRYCRGKHEGSPYDLCLQPGDLYRYGAIDVARGTWFSVGSWAAQSTALAERPRQLQAAQKTWPLRCLSPSPPCHRMP